MRERIDKLEIAGETSENDPKEPLDTSKDNVRWTFVSECLKYLHSIQRVLNAKEDTEGTRLNASENAGMTFTHIPLQRQMIIENCLELKI